MKKCLILLLTFALMLSLCACGSKGNPDHEYIVSLLEKGEYDMAIELIEHLKERESGSTQPADNNVETSTEAPAESSAPVSTGLSGIDEAQVLDLVKQFMKEQGDDLQKQYKKNFGNKPGPISLLNAAEYFLEDADGQGSPAHFILMSIGGNFATVNSSLDAVQVAYDIDRSTFINSAIIDWNYIGSGDISTIEQFHNMIVTAYHSYLSYDGEILWTELETIEDLDAEAINRINEKLS